MRAIFGYFFFLKKNGDLFGERLLLLSVVRESAARRRAIKRLPDSFVLAEMEISCAPLVTLIYQRNYLRGAGVAINVMRIALVLPNPNANITI